MGGLSLSYSKSKLLLIHRPLRSAWGCAFYPLHAAESKDEKLLGHLEVVYITSAHSIDWNSNIWSCLTAEELGDGVQVCAKEGRQQVSSTQSNVSASQSE